MPEYKATIGFEDYQHTFSLWEIAHRWADIDPIVTSKDHLPMKVRDILNAMMNAQLHSELAVTDGKNGIVLKDARYVELDQYIPREEDTWDGTEESRRELYFEFIQKICKRHDDLIDRHADMVKEKIPMDFDYLDKIHVDKYELAKWAVDQGLPFPDFWFNPEEKKATIEQLMRRKVISERFKEEDPEEQRENRTLEAYRQEFLDDSQDEYGNELATLLYSPGKISLKDIDTFWNKLMPNQRVRLISRHIASELWKQDNSLTIVDIEKGELMQTVAGHFGGKNTIREWIKDLDPREPEQKTGRPKKL
ncbi:MAG: hypothetical protein MI976_30430 [Pseudomonadales bacterium]|nr:hypothetical protein [Pseudomonadales bacterium]